MAQRMRTIVLEAMLLRQRMSEHLQVLGNVVRTAIFGHTGLDWTTCFCSWGSRVGVRCHIPQSTECWHVICEVHTEYQLITISRWTKIITVRTTYSSLGYNRLDVGFESTAEVLALRQGMQPSS